LDSAEFIKMVRTGLRIAAKDVSDEDINMLIESLDNDGGGTLDLSELADFVVRGYAALLSSKCKSVYGVRERELFGVVYFGSMKSERARSF
jgi:hypothetical protein